ncbi:FecR family protein [Kriegella aquimaris]|uniref:FecR family protein n=1 Tax=Kriegella aquimaris TaxID=192904 RepID=A0A1G9NSF3_9FLAO|nr:FecR domain-containing protein [Kriegella aquimaris]SDL89243.1 FecR family protein [Kriegella aquimaris]
MKNKKKSNIDFTSLSDTEKVALKSKIYTSLDRLKQKRLRKRYAMGTAASIAVLLALGFYFNRPVETSITDFVKSAKKVDVNDSDKVVLILNEGENVKIDEDSTDISYSSTGQKVSVGGSKVVDQSASSEKEMVYNTVLVPYGKRSNLKLSDGSMVWLNSGSRLVYPAVFKGDKREVYLEGEAIFEVAHDASHPFMVLSESQEIEVLGTVFNVSNYLDDTQVNTVLKSGSVQIQYKPDTTSDTGNKIKITPGTLASYDKKNKMVTSEKVNVDHYFSWRKGVFIFKNNNLEYIMKRLARYYNVDIEIENQTLAEETFSGYLDLREDVEKVIGIIKETTPLQYKKINEKRISIN